MILPLLISGALFLTRCSRGDTALVTINLGRTYAVEPKGMLDRALAFMTGLFVTRLQADPIGGGCTATNIMITVYGDGFEPMTAEIPLETGEITLEVDAGLKIFSVVALDDGYRTCGGRAKVFIMPGSEQTIDIQMGPLPEPPDGTPQVDSSGPMCGPHITWYGASGTTVGYSIYRSEDDGATFILLGATDLGTLIYDDVSAVMGVTYIYRIAGINEYGEGNPGDADPFANNGCK